jgi:TPR repeat protein
MPASARSHGIAQDYGEAAKWYRLSADQGNADAQFNLGILYSNGQGVPRDLVQAHMWFSLAAVSGDADAIENRDGVAEKMTAAQRTQAQALARSWKSKKKP